MTGAAGQSSGRAPPADFDFIIGDWTVQHRRLQARLTGCTTWDEFPGEMSTRKVMGGWGNIEDNVLDIPGGAYRAVALRAFCAQGQTWSIWWLDGRNPMQIDTPVVGIFRDHIGLFEAKDVIDGRPTLVRFTWTATPDANPHWAQAFSIDGGASWETNWTMEFIRR